MICFEFHKTCIRDVEIIKDYFSHGCELSLKRLSGTSGPCETFGNLCLAHNEEFELRNVEVISAF